MSTMDYFAIGCEQLREAFPPSLPSDLERARRLYPGMGEASLRELAEHLVSEHDAIWTGRNDPDDGDVVERGIIREERGR